MFAYSPGSSNQRKMQCSNEMIDWSMKSQFWLESTGCVGPNRMKLIVYVQSLTISRFKTIFFVETLSFKIPYEPIV